MENQHSPIKLTSAEVSSLWSTYVADSMSICVFKYFLMHIEDDDIKKIVKHALDMSQQHIEIIREIFTEEGIHIPQGFTENDVNLDAKRLFSDSFYLFYVHNMANGGLVAYARVLRDIYREDIHSFYAKCLSATMDLRNESRQLLLEKGLAVRPPYIPYPKKVEFIKKQSFMLEGLGRRENLTGDEVANLYANIQTNLIGSALATAFCQVTKSNEVRKYIVRGRDIALKQIKIFSSYLEMASLPVPMSHDQEVTDSTDSPFSDKLMMFQFSIMSYSGIGNYGSAISLSRRSDLVVDYSRLLAEILKFAEDGMNILIDNEWLEQPPMSANRKDLAKD